MEFRWIALLALWTLFSGPAIGPPPMTGERPSATASDATNHPRPQKPIPARR